MNFEGALGLAIILLIAIRATPGAPPTFRPLRGFDSKDALLCLAIGAAITAVFWRAARSGFLSDDFIMLSHAGHFHPRSIFTTGGGDGFFRPLIYAIFSWTRGWAGLDPVLWHSGGLALHAANAILLYLVAWALGYSRFAAGFAAALFAVHATRPEVAVWITGRFDLFATMFVLIALFFFVRAWDVPQPRALLYRSAALVSMILGLLCKESAYAFPLMALVLVVMHARTGSRSRGMMQALPFFLAAALLFFYRWHLLGGIGGYRNSAGEREILSVRFVGVFKGLALRLWAILFMPVNWAIQPGFLFWVAVAIYLLSLLWLASTRVQRQACLLPLALLLAAAMPVAHLLLIGSNLEKSRYLYLPSAAFALLLATVIDASGAAKQKWLAAAAILVFQVAALEHNLGAWESAATRAESACALVANAASVDAPIAILDLPRTLRGVYFFANGFPECVEFRNPNHPPVTVLRESARPIDRSKFPVIFKWDAQTEDLRLQP